MAAAIAAITPVSPALTPPSPARQPWPDLQVARRPAPTVAPHEDFGEFTFEGNATVSTDESRPMTIMELCESGEPVERIETERPTPKGAKSVSTADLVRDLLAQNGRTTRPAPAKRPRSRKSKASRAE